MRGFLILTFLLAALLGWGFAAVTDDATRRDTGLVWQQVRP